MRILNVTQSYAPFLEFGGPPVKVRALSEAMSRRGHQLTVLTPDWGFEQRLGEKISASGIDRSPFGWRREQDRVQSIYLPIWLRYRSLSWNPAVKRFARARLKNFDVVHIFGLYDLLGPAVAAGCRRSGTPYVVEPMGMFRPIVRSVRLKRIYHALLGRTMLTGAHYLIATSEQEQGELASAGLPAGNLVLRRNGVDVPVNLPERGMFRKAHGIPADAKLILFLGRLSQKKSPELLLHAFTKLPSQFTGRSTRIAFVGPDERGMRAKLAEIAKERNVAARVHFLGALFEQDKWAAYRDADVFVLPSQNENFGNTAAEAAAAGTPVIVTRECGVAPLLGDRAALIVAHDEEAIRQAMEKLLGDPVLHAQLAAGCGEAVARLGWEEPAAAMETLYRQLVEAESRVS